MAIGYLLLTALCATAAAVAGYLWGRRPAPAPPRRVPRADERERLLDALALGERTVEEVMKHRSAIQTLDADLPPRDLLDRCLASAHTRLPLWRGEPENIVGVLHAKDLLRALHALWDDGEGAGGFDGFDVMTVAQKPYFVPETTTLEDQLRQFLRRRRHFALVVDEYGVLQGMVTLEDILEEIIGEIADEFDLDPEAPLKRDEDGSVIVEGAMTVRDFVRATDWPLPDDAANTVAGVVIHEAQMIPSEGQVFSVHGLRFEVMTRKDNRLSRLKVRPL
jgi:Mg2+/Co2+ transporter CorB